MAALAFCNDDVMIQIKWWRGTDLAISPLVGQHFRGTLRAVTKNKSVPIVFCAGGKRIGSVDLD
jgi:hypothetical protein